MIKKLLVMLLLCSPAFGQWTFVQNAWNSTSGNVPSPATTTVSLPSVGSGHVVVASVVYLGTATGFTVSVTDGNGNSFTATPHSPCAYIGGEQVSLFYLLNTPAASMTVTVTPTVAHGLSIHVIEFTPPAGTVSFDTDSCSAPSTGTTPVTTPGITPTSSGLLYAGILADPGGSGSISAVLGSWNDGTHGSIASDAGESGDEYQIGATTLTTVGWSIASSIGTGWDAMVMSLRVPPPNPASLVVRGKIVFKGNVIIK